eukprot:g663.t1
MPKQSGSPSVPQTVARLFELCSGTAGNKIVSNIQHTGIYTTDRKKRPLFVAHRFVPKALDPSLGDSSECRVKVQLDFPVAVERIKESTEFRNGKTSPYWFSLYPDARRFLVDQRNRAAKVSWSHNDSRINMTFWDVPAGQTFQFGAACVLKNRADQPTEAFKKNWSKEKTVKAMITLVSNHGANPIAHSSHFKSEGFRIKSKPKDGDQWEYQMLKLGPLGWEHFCKKFITQHEKFFLRQEFNNCPVRFKSSFLMLNPKKIVGAPRNRSKGGKRPREHQTYLLKPEIKSILLSGLVDELQISEKRGQRLVEKFIAHSNLQARDKDEGEDRRYIPVKDKQDFVDEVYNDDFFKNRQSGTRQPPGDKFQLSLLVMFMMKCIMMNGTVRNRARLVHPTLRKAKELYRLETMGAFQNGRWGSSGNDTGAKRKVHLKKGGKKAAKDAAGKGSKKCKVVSMKRGLGAEPFVQNKVAKSASPGGKRPGKKLKGGNLENFKLLCDAALFEVCVKP